MQPFASVYYNALRDAFRCSVPDEQLVVACDLLAAPLTGVPAKRLAAFLHYLRSCKEHEAKTIEFYVHFGVDLSGDYEGETDSKGNHAPRCPASAQEFYDVILSIRAAIHRERIAYDAAAE